MQQNNTVECKVFNGGNLTENLNSLKTWFNSQELKRDQIVAINIDETTTIDGDSEVSFIYRK